MLRRHALMHGGPSGRQLGIVRAAPRRGHSCASGQLVPRRQKAKACARSVDVRLLNRRLYLRLVFALTVCLCPLHNGVRHQAASAGMCTSAALVCSCRVREGRIKHPRLDTPEVGGDATRCSSVQYFGENEAAVAEIQCILRSVLDATDDVGQLMVQSRIV